MRDGVPELYQAVTKRALAGTASKRDAIRAFCLECMGWKRLEVSACEAPDCPLWKYRPYSSPPAV